MYMQESMPFYKAYPLEPFLAENKWMEQEKERMISYLPGEYQRIQKKVEGTCDEMEYEGSRMYDEHPDQMMIRRIAQRLVDETGDEREKQYMEDITSCLLCNEILYRRYRRRRGKQYIR